MIGDLDMVLRLVVAGVLGGIVGYERQSRHKIAGLRTHILVCLGSCLIMILSINVYAAVQGLTNADPARLAAQVVSGIGFLGAGSIMKEGLTVKGLTTAASLWVVAGIGLAAGSAYYAGAVTTTVLVFATLSLVSRWEKHICMSGIANLVVNASGSPGQIGKIGVSLGEVGIHIRDIKIEEQSRNNINIYLTVQLLPNMKADELLPRLMTVEGVRSVRHE